VRTLYRASLVRTLGGGPDGTWLLVDDRHVQRVGSGDPPVADRTVDLPGATIVPGFIDAHVHLTGTGLSLHEADTAATRSGNELLALARGRAATDRDPVVFLRGFDETSWVDPRLPDLASLDASCDRPLVIRRADGHMALANSAALAFSRALEAEGCDRIDGQPTGVVRSEANRRVGRWVAESRTPHRIEELQLAAAATAATAGITSVHEMAMPEDDGFRDVEVLLAHRRRLPVDVHVVVSSTDVARVLDLGVHAIGGDLPADGSIGARTAALSEPYADVDHVGATYYADDVLAAFFHDAHDAGLQAGIHAIGDRAIDQVLSAWERVHHALDSRERRHFRARRHRIEHFELATPEQIERAAMLGLAVGVQPAFDARWGGPGGLYERALGEDRAMAMNRFATMLERGLTLGVGSDAPVTPLDGWAAVAAMEDHHDPAQRLDRATAVRAHTAGSAGLAHQEEKKGSLAPGTHADFAAYDADPMTVEAVHGLRPVLTVSLGREVHAA
jgi:predicted amidohydrolase YtcJ